MQAEQEEDLDVPPLSSCTVEELKQLLSMTRQAYDAYVSQGTESGKIGARLCAEEIAEIEALIKSASTSAGGDETLQTSEHPSCK
jgi:hypothetical protein